MVEIQDEDEDKLKDLDIYMPLLNDIPDKPANYMSVFDFCNHFVNLYKPLEILFRVFKINLNIIKEDHRIDQILLSSEFTSEVTNKSN